MTLIALSGAKLQAARKAATERFLAIAAKHTPEDVTIEYRNGLSGRAWVQSRRMVAPKPTTRRRLHIYLHEIGHIVLGHSIGSNKRKPKHVQEMEAEQFAFRIMREEGVPIPRKSKEDAKRYVAHKIKQAKRRGAKKIDKRAQQFATGRLTILERGLRQAFG
jgi:hypothetical protein